MRINLSRKARGVTSTVLLVIASVCLLVGDLALYADRVVLDSKGFSNHAVKAIEDDRVKDAVTAVLVDAIIEQGSEELITARPVLEAAVSGIVGTTAFKEVFRGAVKELHATLFSAEGQSIVLDLADAGVIISAALRSFDKETAQMVPDELEEGLIEIGDRNFATDLLKVVEDVRFLAIASLIAAALLMALSVVVAPDRRKILFYIGIALALVAIVAIAGNFIGRRVLVSQLDGDVVRAAASGVWEGFMGDLRSWNLVLGGAGVVISLSAASILRPIDIQSILSKAGSVITYSPEGLWGRLLRALIFIAVGLLVLFEFDLVLDVLFVTTGIFILSYGVSEILRLTVDSRKPKSIESKDGPVANDEARPAKRTLRTGPRVAALLILVLGIGLGALFIIRGGGDNDELPISTKCNGHQKLCDRQLNEVAFAATHNSMSAAAEPGWLFASHKGTIRDQLDFGIRGLLIDTWYGAKEGNTVRTDLEASGKDREDLIKERGAAAVRAAERLGGRLGFDIEKSKRKTYLCHGLCELGATDFVDALKGIKKFLIVNPNEVLIIFIEDEVTPKDTEKAFKDSGLIDLVYTYRKGAEFPTLEQMILEDKRVLVLAENKSSGVDWYIQGFDIVQETPFSVTSVSGFNCRPNRGNKDNPLFLLNNWIDKLTPSPADAEKVNSYDFLLKRARRCEKERGHIPNLVAVNFSEKGDVLGVVDTLNGVRKSRRNKSGAK